MNSPTASTPRKQNGVIDKLIAAADTLSLVGAYIAMACLVAVASIMLGQVVVAGLSKITTAVRGDIPVGWEYGSYLMGATFMFGSGITLRAGRHIRLGIGLASAPPRLAKAMEVFATVVGMLFVGFLVYSLFQSASQSFRMDARSIGSATPIWIPMSVFAAGAGILFIQLCARLLALLTGREVDNLSLRGTQSQVE